MLANSANVLFGRDMADLKLDSCIQLCCTLLLLLKVLASEVTPEGCLDGGGCILRPQHAAPCLCLPDSLFLCHLQSIFSGVCRFSETFSFQNYLCRCFALPKACTAHANDRGEISALASGMNASTNEPACQAGILYVRLPSANATEGLGQLHCAMYDNILLMSCVISAADVHISNAAR